MKSRPMDWLKKFMMPLWLILSGPFLYASNFDVRSATLWEKDTKFVYFPGVRAVLSDHRDWGRYGFRLEFYLQKPVDAYDLIFRTRGSWSFQKDLYRSDYLQEVDRYCGQQPSYGINNEFIGYPCSIDFTVFGRIPSGAISVTVGLIFGSEVVYHPNLYFTLVIPDGEQMVSSQHRFDELATHSARQPRFFSENIREQVRRNMVQISLEGNFSLGSGFFVRPDQQFFQNLGLETPNQNELAILTAAHLFPADFSYNEDRYLDVSVNQRDYDIRVGGRLVREAATLVYRDLSLDLAILKIKNSKVKEVLDPIGLTSPTLAGLPIGQQLDVNCRGNCNAVEVIGYPVSQKGGIYQVQAHVDDGVYPTDDTSNFGRLRKFKVLPLEREIGPFAEAGMSGGAVVNGKGEVMGLIIEKPVREEALIALDLTSLGALTRSAPTDRCRFSFNPFDRFFELVNQSKDCQYGDFGSDLVVGRELKGHWALQEVFALSTNADSFHGHRLTSGHQFINGHGIINGNGIIRPTENGESLPILAINEANVDEVNRTIMKDGFRFNPDSFRPMTVRGVRLLEVPPELYQQLSAAGERLVVGYRDRPWDSFRPVYSLRDFVLWLHRFSDHPDFIDLIEIAR